MKNRILITVLLFLSFAPIKLSAAIDAEKEISKINEKIDNIYKIVDNIYSMLDKAEKVAQCNSGGQVKQAHHEEYVRAGQEKSKLLQEKQNIQKK